MVRISKKKNVIIIVKQANGTSGGSVLLYKEKWDSLHVAKVRKEQLPFPRYELIIILFVCLFVLFIP